MQALFLMYLISGILLALLSLPLLAGRIKPNAFYGFRVKTTLENIETWYAVNKFFAQRQLGVALVEIIATLGFYFWPNISVDGYALSVLAAFVIAFSIAFRQSWRYLNSLN